jgi:hypothetical protein
MIYLSLILKNVFNNITVFSKNENKKRDSPYFKRLENFVQIFYFGRDHKRAIRLRRVDF